MTCSNGQLKLVVAVLSVCLFVAIVVPLSIMLHNGSSESDGDDSDMASVLKRYGHFFVSLEDEEALKARLVKTARTKDGQEMTFELCMVYAPDLMTSVNYNNNNNNNSSSNTSCSSASPSSASLIAMDSQSKLSAPLTAGTNLHGCCNSTASMIVPATAISPPSGQKVTLVQYPPRYVQMFSVETCQTVDSCNLNCKCFNVLSYATAIVRNGKRATPKVIQYKGCCKCMNNA